RSLVAPSVRPSDFLTRIRPQACFRPPLGSCDNRYYVVPDQPRALGPLRPGRSRFHHRRDTRRHDPGRGRGSCAVAVEPAIPGTDATRQWDDVFLFGAFGPCKKGWADVSRTFDWVAGRYRDGTVRSEYEV